MQELIPESLNIMEEETWDRERKKTQTGYVYEHISVTGKGGSYPEGFNHVLLRVLVCYVKRMGKKLGDYEPILICHWLKCAPRALNS